MPNCSAINCSLRTEDGIRLFKCPTNKQRRSTWLSNSKRKDTENKTIYFCERHFEKSQWELNRADGWLKLKQTAIPTIFDIPNPPQRIDPIPRRGSQKDWILIQAEDQCQNFQICDKVYKYRNILKENVNVNNCVNLKEIIDTNKQKKKSETQCIQKQQNIAVHCTQNYNVEKKQNELEAEVEELKARNKILELENKAFRTAMEAECTTLKKECIEYKKSTIQLKKQIDFIYSRLKSFLTSDQILSLGKMKLKQWCKEGIVKCLKIRFNLGIHGYEYLRSTCYPMPSIRTLSRKLDNLTLTENVCETNNLDYPVVSGFYVDQLWASEVHKSENLRTLYHLSSEDLNPSNFDKMNVASAMRYFSHKTAEGIQLGIAAGVLSQEAATTAWFIKLVADWFELSTSRHRKVGPTRRNLTKKIELLKKMGDAMNGIIIGDLKWKPLHRGFATSTLSLQNIIETVLKVDGTDYVLLQRFTQDALENVFCQIRKRAGKTPTVSACLKALKIITVAQYINSRNKGGSYLSESDTFLIDVFKKSKSNQENKTEKHNHEVVKMEKKFPTYTQRENPIRDAGGSIGSVTADFILFVAKGVLYTFLESDDLCDGCYMFLKNGLNMFHSYDYLEYVNGRDPNNLYSSDALIIDLVLNCEIVYDKYEKFISHQENQFIQKVLKDIKVPFPKCVNGCTSLKEMGIHFFFNMRKPALLLKTFGKFPTYSLTSQDFTALGFSLKDINLVYYICGSIVNSLLKLKLCVSCRTFLQSNFVENDQCKIYTKARDFGALKHCNKNIFELVVNCEIIFKNNESLIVKCRNNKGLIVKISEDLDVLFPKCTNGCVNIKQKTVELFFNARSSAIVSLSQCRKIKKTMHGTATNKTRKV